MKINFRRFHGAAPAGQFFIAVSKFDMNDFAVRVRHLWPVQESAKKNAAGDAEPQGGVKLPSQNEINLIDDGIAPLDNAPQRSAVMADQKKIERIENV